MRVALYIRQSDSSGHGVESLSIASQEAELRARCAREGWHIVAVESEADVRGWQDESERPGLSRVLDLASRGDIELVLVFDLSRLARSLEMQERWIRILGAMGVEVESHTEPEARRSTLLRQIKGAIAEEKTREIRAHVRRSMRERAERGLSHGRAPYGYTRAPKSPLEIDPAEADIVRRIFAMRVNGDSTSAIRQWLEDASVPTPFGAGVWRWDGVDFILKNPAYKGVVKSGPVWQPNAHPAIVDERTWELAQTRATRYLTRPRGSAPLTWLHGLVDHACGKRMHCIDTSLSHPVPYFRCPNTSRQQLGIPECGFRPGSISSNKLEKAIWAEALDVLDRLMTADEILADARQRFREQAPDANRERRLAEAAAERARHRLARAEELYLEAKRDRAWFDAEDARVRAELEAAESRVAALPRPPDRSHIDAQLTALRSLRDAAAGLQGADRSRLVRALGRVVVGDGPPRLVVDEDIAELVKPR